MSKTDEIEDNEVQDFLKFLQVANDTCKEKGKIYEFECPLCHGMAEGTKSNYNGHLWAKCKNAI